MNAPERGWLARVPWATGLVAIGALALHRSPDASRALEFDRARILAGEWWRVWTGHFAHFGLSHLGWNVAVFLPAGIWAERLTPARTRALLALAPAMIGGVLLAFDPALEIYAGLSGVVSGVVTLLALTQLAATAREKWFWWSVLALLALKIGVEVFAGQPIFARGPDAGFRAVPLAHVAGVLCALAVHAVGRRGAPPANP